MAVNGHFQTDHEDRGDLVLRLRDVSFSYQVVGSVGASNGSPGPREEGDWLIGGLLRRAGRRRFEVQALDRIDLDLYAGDRVGIMGPNGAGKSTLLRVMGGIYPPSAGDVRAWGTVSAILGQSHGMDPELTGYENIRVRGLFLGVPEDEIRARAAEIAEYSELGPYLDMPLRVYSAGMRMRLGFSISTCFQPDILLLDEWLTAGDRAFMNKATARMAQFVDAARSVVVVSHNRGLLEKTCDVILTMERGRICGAEPLMASKENHREQP